MACEVCEHCDTVVGQGAAIVRQGYSYHSRCHKCYVCSETNLQNADIFKGVIFCSGCSNRIFQGCSTARRVKTRKSRRRFKKKRRNNKRCRQNNENRVLALARLTHVMDRRSQSDISTILKSSTPTSTVATAITTNTYKTKNTYNLQKDSTEMGTTTTVTQELLKRIHSPIYHERKISTPVEPRKNCKSKREPKCKNNDYSDLRIAGLGTSTEIAHMALRRPSELPVIIRSEIGLKPIRSQSVANLTDESDGSSAGHQKHLSYSEYSSKDLMRSNHWMDKTIGSILKLPYRSFKRNILDRSSLISVIVSSRQSACIIKRIKTLFHHEITEHQTRGLNRLFSTINRRKTDYKLGWLNVMKRIPEDERLPDSTQHPGMRCKHFRHSHSYRCMRTQVMRLAGPTRSELVLLRKKLGKTLFLNTFKSLHDQFVDITTFKASG